MLTDKCYIYDARCLISLFESNTSAWRKEIFSGNCLDPHGNAMGKMQLAATNTLATGRTTVKDDTHTYTAQNALCTLQQHDN